MAELFRFVKYYNNPEYMYIYKYMHLGSKALWKAYQALLVPQA